MKNYEIVRLPVMNRDGRWLAVDPSRWGISFDRSGFFKLSSSEASHTLSLGNLIAVEIGSEQEVNAIGKTIGRMALTGVGAALFSQGRSGGMGAGLLDLSIRGAEKKTIVSGALVFMDSSILKFTLPGKDFEQLASAMPEHVFTQEALQNASEMFGLLSRMKADGERVLTELIDAYNAAKARTNGLIALAETGNTFSERDAARQQLAVAEHDLHRERFLFTALLFDMGIAPADFVAKASGHGNASELISVADAPQGEDLRQAIGASVKSSAEPPGRPLNRREIGFGTLAIIVVLYLVWRHYQ